MSFVIKNSIRISRDIHKLIQNKCSKTYLELQRKHTSSSISMAQRLTDKVAIVTASTDG